jgi:cyclophilin family peptidyl-prolyl cis-trans isomerase
MRFELFCDRCPKTTFNFLALAASGYYDGCVWHRVIPGFIVQTGDPSGTGEGGTSIWGDDFADEIAPDSAHPGAEFDAPGRLAMAVAGPNENRSQFFVTLAATPTLSGTCTLFGRLTHGAAALGAIGGAKADADGRPLEDVVLRSVTVHENPHAEADKYL